MTCNPTENFILKGGLEVADSADFGGLVTAEYLNVNHTANFYGDVNITIGDLVVGGLGTFGGGLVVTGGGGSITGGLTVTIGGFTVGAGGADITGGSTFRDSADFLGPVSFADGFTVSGGVPVFGNGFTTSGGTTTFGNGFTSLGNNTFSTGITTFGNGFTSTGNNTFSVGSTTFERGFNVTGGTTTFGNGLTVSTGGLTIDLGGLTIDAGGLTVIGASRFDDVLTLNSPPVINADISMPSHNITVDGATLNTINGISYPTADGTNNQTLITDGNGNLSFADLVTALLNTIGTTGNNGQVLSVDGTGGINVTNVTDILGWRLNIPEEGANDGDLLIYDEPNGEFRLSTLSEQHIIEGGQY